MSLNRIKEFVKSTAIVWLIVALIMRETNYTNGGVVAGFIAAIAIGSAVGFLNALITEKFKVPALLSTISTQYVFYGISQVLTTNKAISTASAPRLFSYLGSGRIFGLMPCSIGIMLVLGIIMFII